MCQFVETIRITDGQIHHLALHQDRVGRTLRHFAPQLSEFNLEPLLVDCPQVGVWKTRVLYDTLGNVAVAYHPYVLRTLHSLRLVVNDDLDYSFKYADRTPLTALQAQRGACDEVLIVRQGLITDTSYTNVAFTDGRSWYTPRQPLLAGTMRRALLEKGVLQERDIRPEDLSCYKEVALFNAMIDFGQVVLSSQQIST